MTEKEKAIAYDEAIQKLRGMMPNWERLSYNGKTFLQDLIYIFPELKGSEDDEEIVKLADEYYDKVLINECDMEEKEARHCRISYIHGAKAMLDWLEKQGQKFAWTEEDAMIQNGIILDGVVYELTTGFPDNKLSLCGNCELNEKCIEFDGSLCYFFADNYRKVFRKVKMERKL